MQKLRAEVSSAAYMLGLCIRTILKGFFFTIKNFSVSVWQLLVRTMRHSLIYYTDSFT